MKLRNSWNNRKKRETDQRRRDASFLNTQASQADNEFIAGVTSHARLSIGCKGARELKEVETTFKIL